MTSITEEKLESEAAPRPSDARPKPGRQVGLLSLSVFAITVGVLTGFGAAALRSLMAFFHNLFFLGKVSFYYDANVFDPLNPWGALIILAPVIGGLGVVFLVKNFAPEAKGHGVPEVMDAVYYRQGKVRPIVVVVKSLASALSIGSGASVGREGPIIQIGSGIGSSIGQLLGLSPWQTITLVAAGAGAGIAATFNTPLGAVMFAIELILPEVSPRTFLPVVLATGAATSVGWLFFGVSPAFLVPLSGVIETGLPLSVTFLPLYVVLGGLCGVASMLFIRAVDWMEDIFPRLHPNAYVQNIIGMFLLGVMLYAFYVFTGHYHVDGVGYATIQGIFTGEVSGIGILLLLFLAKTLATSMSLGAGASGGIFSPSLYLGATLGGAFGSVLSLIWPGLGINPVEFAVIGMAGVVGGGTGAAMTAILMIFEMTQDYHAIVPTIITVACAIALRRVLMEENIYTIKLARRGHHIPKSRHSHVFFIRHAREYQAPILGTLPLHEFEKGENPYADQTQGYVLVTEGDNVVGLMPLGEDRPRDGSMVRDYCVVRGDDFLRDVIRQMMTRNRRFALVAKDDTSMPTVESITGVTTRERLGNVFLEQWNT